MKKILIALAAAAALFSATIVAPNTADASHRSWHTGATIAGVVIGGALIAGALAPRYRPYAVQQGYEPYPTYVSAYPVDCPGGYWARKPLVNQWGQVVGYGKPRFFCPAY